MHFVNDLRDAILGQVKKKKAITLTPATSRQKGREGEHEWENLKFSGGQTNAVPLPQTSWLCNPIVTYIILGRMGG